MPYQTMWVNSSTWYPITKTESPGLMPTTYSELTCHRVVQTLKEKNLPHLGKVEDQVTLCWAPQICMPHYIDWMAGGQLLKSNMILPPTQSSEGSSYSVHSWYGLQTNTSRQIHMPWVYLKGWSGANPNGSPIYENGSYIRNWKQKVDSITPTWRKWWETEL